MTIKTLLTQIEPTYKKSLFNAIATRWGLCPRHIREYLIPNEKLTGQQEKELIKVLEKQIEFQEKVKQIEIKHFDKL